MKVFLIISVLFIIFYESYWPLPDYDKIEYDKYSEEAKYLSQGEVPVSILVYFKVENEKELFLLLKKYPQCRNRDYKVWIKNIRPKLYKSDVQKIVKYENYNRKG